MKIKLPSIPSPPDDDALCFINYSKKEKMKAYADKRRTHTQQELREGDVVLIRQKKTGKLVTLYNPKPYRVISVKGTMITAQRHGHIVTRNQSFFRSLKHHTEVPLTTPRGDESEDDDDEGNIQVNPQHPNEPKDIPQPVRRYPDRPNRQPSERDCHLKCDRDQCVAVI